MENDTETRRSEELNVNRGCIGEISLLHRVYTDETGFGGIGVDPQCRIDQL